MPTTWPFPVRSATTFTVLIRHAIAVAASSLLLFGVGCGAGQVSAESAEPHVAPPPPAPDPNVLPKGHIWRYQLMEVMSPGMGAFLRRVDVREQMVGSQFHGFRLIDLRGDPTFWQGSDLRVGDVVTSVNGGSLGHYDDAFKIWQSLVTAHEIVIAYERRGEPKQLRLVIHEDGESPEQIRESAKQEAGASKPDATKAKAPPPK